MNNLKLFKHSSFNQFPINKSVLKYKNLSTFMGLVQQKRRIQFLQYLYGILNEVYLANVVIGNNSLLT